jgi:predicted phosphodiesterase
MPILDPLATPARIGFAGDWHANTRWATSAIGYAAEHGAGVILHLGDFGYEFRPAFLRGLDRALAATNLQLLFVDGNHEAFPTLLRYPVRGNGLRQVSERVWHLPRGFRWTWGGVRFLALGGAYSIDRQWRTPGSSWWWQEEITDEQVAAAIAGPEVDVLISHDCPTGVAIPDLEESADQWPPLDLIRAEGHRRQLARVAEVTRPRWLWHGHYHRRYDATADLGYGPVAVRGLDCDATSFDANVVVVDLEELSTSALASTDRD